MKEVTRIHIAKVSYDIEIAAKKKLESYIDALTVYAEDENVLEDIEIRITELLEQRGIKANGMIGLEDVASIRETLGEPSYFSGEGDIAIGPEEDVVNPSRKLYRDIDRAVFGGVLSGIANYFKINALWVRLAFIILTFVSFGFMTLVYIVLWVAIPAAKTVTEKLQMRGEPVTLGTIRKYNEGHEGVDSTKERLRLRRKGFGIFLGIIGVLGAISSLFVTIAAAIAWRVAMGTEYSFKNDWIIFSLIIASGALLTALGIVIARSGFLAKLTKRSAITGLVIVVGGILTFSAAGALVGYEVWQREDTLRQSVKEHAITLPVNFSEAKTLTVNAEYATIEYRVSDDFRATVMGLPGVNATLKQEGNGVSLGMEYARAGDAYRYQPSVIVYGPKLDSIVVNGGAFQYTAKSQDIELTMASNVQASVFGAYGKLTANLQEGTLNAEGASIKNATVTMQPDTTATLGNIDSLEVSQPTACPNDSQARLLVESIRSDMFTHNGKQLPKTNYKDSCGMVQIGSIHEAYREIYE